MPGGVPTPLPATRQAGAVFLCPGTESQGCLHHSHMKYECTQGAQISPVQDADEGLLSLPQQLTLTEIVRGKFRPHIRDLLPIQGHAARYITGIRGDYFNVVGLPVRRLYETMKLVFGIHL